MLQFLNKFVDVDKAQGVYFINDEKVGTPEGNFTEKDYQELQLVSPGNRAIFEGKLNFLNEKLAEVATRSDVSQIVYSTYGGDTWVRPLQSNPAISIEKSDNLDVRATRALLGQMYLYYGATQYCNFQGARQIKSNVNIVLNITLLKLYVKLMMRQNRPTWGIQQEVIKLGLSFCLALPLRNPILSHGRLILTQV